MREYYQAIGIEPFSILPVTYLVNSINDEEFRRFEAQYKRHLEVVKKHKEQR